MILRLSCLQDLFTCFLSCSELFPYIFDCLVVTQGSRDGTQHGLQASRLDKGNGRQNENARGAANASSAARRDGEDMQQGGGTFYGVNCSTAEDHEERLQGAAAEDGGQVKQSSSSLGQEIRPVKVSSCLPQQQPGQGFGATAWSSDHAGWPSGLHQGSAHTNPPFVFTSATEEGLAHRSPRNRVLRHARSQKGPAAPAPSLSTLFGPASDAAKPLGRQTSVKNGRVQQQEVFLQRSASVEAANGLQETSDGLNRKPLPRAADAGTSLQFNDGQTQHPDPWPARRCASFHSSEVLGQQAAGPLPSAHGVSAYPRADVALSGRPHLSATAGAWVQEPSSVIPPVPPVYARRAGRQAGARGNQRAQGLGTHTGMLGQQTPAFQFSGEQVQPAKVYSTSPCAEPEFGNLSTQAAPVVAPAQAAHDRDTTSPLAARAEGLAPVLPQCSGPSPVRSSPISILPCHIKSPLPRSAAYGAVLVSVQQSPARESPGAEQRLGGIEAGQGTSPRVSGMRAKVFQRTMPPWAPPSGIARPSEGAVEQSGSPYRPEGKTESDRAKVGRQPFSQVLNPPVVNQPQGASASVCRSKSVPFPHGHSAGLYSGDPSIPIRVMRHDAGPGSSAAQGSRCAAQGLGNQAAPPPVAQPTMPTEESAAEPSFSRTLASARGSGTVESQLGRGFQENPVSDKPFQPMASASWQFGEEHRVQGDVAHVSGDKCVRAATKDNGLSQPTRKEEGASKPAHAGEAAVPVPPLFFTYGGQAQHTTPSLSNFSIPPVQSANVAASKVRPLHPGQ